MRKILRLILLFPLILLFCGWGYNGHKIMNGMTVFSFPEEMSQFRIWQQLLEQHASDADTRKSTDPSEEPKHYIDIDNYPEFVSTGQISQDFDSLVAIHGYTFVMDQGILPWAIIAAYDSLTQAFLRRDWNKAVLFASDLGHYVGDAHMPLHLTRNYNGQYTGQSGIHSRYESSMINRYYTQINYESDSVSLIQNIPNFIFSFIYSNYLYCDSLLAADIAAKSIAGNTTSDLYYQKLWEFTADFTTKLFKNTSGILAGLIYSSWVAAGKPSMITEAEELFAEHPEIYLEQNYPNPFNPSTTINYSLDYPGYVNISIYNINGMEVSNPVKGYLPAGRHKLMFDGSSLPSGIYIYILETGYIRLFGKMLLIK